MYTTKTLTGAYAEYALAAQADVHVVPAALSFAEGAALGTPYFTAYRALFTKLAIRPGRTLLVHGATGGVGVAAVQMARAHGLRVIGTAGSEAGMAALAPLCDAVVRHGTATAVEDVRAAAGGSGVDYIVEMLANVNLGADLKMLARGGAVCVVGSRGDVTITPRDLMRAEATITAVTLFSATPADIAETDAYIAAGARTGALKPLLGTQHAGLAAAAAAHREVIDHAGGAHGKIIILV